jgi:hypothetical protein
VHRLERQGFEDEHVQGSLHEVATAGGPS